MVKSFDIQVDRIHIAEPTTSLTTIIVIIVLMVIITIILVIMATVYARNNDKWCYQNSSRPYINPDIRVMSNILKSLGIKCEVFQFQEQKEPLQVQHHPYARPSAK